MLLREVEYARAESIEDAVRLLSQHPNARALAGGQTLVNVMKARAAAPDVLVDITRIEELKGIRPADGGLELGAMTTYTELVDSAAVSEARPLLGEVANTIADVQVRNRGTVGGNVCSNDPTNHLPPLMVAMGAQMTIVGGDGERTVPAEDFFLGVYMTAAGPGELLTKVTLPARNGAHDGFSAVTIGRDGTCIVNVAATARDGEARVAVGCVSATPILFTCPADEDAAVGALRDADLDPPADVHASADYRRHLAEVLTRRAVRSATQGGLT